MSKANDVEEIEFLELGETTPDNNDMSTSNDDVDDDKDKDKQTDNDRNNEESTSNEDDSPDENTDRDLNETDTTDEPDPDPNDQDQPDEDDLDGEGDEPSLFEDIVSSSGVEFEEDEMEEILQLEETDEGLNQVADRIAEKKAEQRLSGLLEQNPHTQRMLEYEMSGGDPEKYYDAYFPENDYQEMEIEEDDVQTQKQVVSKTLELQGLDEEDINEQIDDLEAAGILHKNAKRSLKALQKHQEAKQQEIEQEREELVQQRQQEAQETFENTVEIVKEGDVEGIEVPQDKQEEFIEYMFEPVNEQGHSQAQIDANQTSLEQRVLMAYLNFSGYNLDGFINSKADTSGKRNLRKAMQKSNSKGGPKSKGDKVNSKPGSPDDIVSPFDI